MRKLVGLSKIMANEAITGYRDEYLQHEQITTVCEPTLSI